MHLPYLGKVACSLKSGSPLSRTTRVREVTTLPAPKDPLGALKKLIVQDVHATAIWLQDPSGRVHLKLARKYRRYCGDKNRTGVVLRALNELVDDQIIRMERETIRRDKRDVELIYRVQSFSLTEGSTMPSAPAAGAPTPLTTCLATQQWEPRLAALRDLILHRIVVNGGELVSNDGRVVSLIRDYYGIPRTNKAKTALSRTMALMDEAGLIVRQMTSSGRGCKCIILGIELTSAEKAQLASAAPTRVKEIMARLQQVTDTDQAETGDADEPAPSPETLLHDDAYLQALASDCNRSIHTLLAVAEQAEHKDSEASSEEVIRAVIRGHSVVRGLGLSYERRLEVFHYLKGLGLAITDGQIDRYNHWWLLKRTAMVEAEVLRDRIRDGHAFRGVPQRDAQARKSASPKDTDPAATRPAEPAAQNGHKAPAGRNDPSSNGDRPAGGNPRPGVMTPEVVATNLGAKINQLLRLNALYQHKLETADQLRATDQAELMTLRAENEHLLADNARLVEENKTLRTASPPSSLLSQIDSVLLAANERGELTEI